MTTKVELRRMMLAHLTVIDATETPDPEQASLADLWIDGARAFLLEKGLCWWDEDEIPASVSIPLSHFCAAMSPSSFGRGGKGYEALGPGAMRQIAALKSSDQREEVPTEYS